MSSPEMPSGYLARLAATAASLGVVVPPELRS